MDKQNTTIGVLLLIAAFASLYFSARMAPPPPPAREMAPQSAPMPGSENVAPGPAQSGFPATSPSDATFAAVASANTNAIVTTLDNEHVQVRLTDFGGAIRDVAFRQYSSSRDRPEDPYVFNALHADPMLAFTEFPGLDRSTRYTLVSATSTEVVYQAVFENRVEVTRRYTLPSPRDTSRDPYRIRHETTFRNLTDITTPLPRATFSLGTTALVSANDYGQFLNVAAFDGKDAHYTDRGDLEGGGFLSWFGLKDGSPRPFIELPVAVSWAAIKNQFFASIYSPDQPGTSVVTRRIELPPFPGATRTNVGLTGAARFDVPALPPGGSATLGGDFYVGPKEYIRLTKFERDEDRVMQFDRYFFNRMLFSGYVAPLMNTLMNWTHSWTGNWGVAIVLMTLILKIVTLPFTLAASRSAKRMQKLQPLMKEVREKHKDDPAKLNQATIAIFKEHKVNPMGGCLPILITIPLFVGFFTMLQGTAELRFQSFLWSSDLSAPDTVFRIFGLPINIMPLLMGATMVYQMRLTPTPTADSTQATIFKLMPIIFTLICYNFATALALYSTINGVLTIIQQVLVNKFTKDEPLAVAAPKTDEAGVPVGNPWKKPSKDVKKVKNVTPKKK